MKVITYLFSATLAFLLIACEKPASSGGGTAPGGAGAAVSVDVSPLEKAFANAEPAVKAAAEKAVAAVKSADFKPALEQLQKLAGEAKLTDDQKKVVSDLVAKVQTALGGAATKMTEGANKAIGDAQKALGK